MRNNTGGRVGGAWLAIHLSVLLMMGMGNASLAGPLDFNLSEGLADKVRKGNEAYRKGDLGEAMKRYSDALVDDPKSQAVRMNMGSVLYKKKKYEAAQRAFEGLTSEEDRLTRARAFYNRGNTLYRLAIGAPPPGTGGKPGPGAVAKPGGRGSVPALQPTGPAAQAKQAEQAARMDLLKKSLESYIEALKLDPVDVDAKYNVVYIRRKIKEQSKRQKQPKQDRKNKQQKKKQKKDDPNKDKKKQGQQKQKQKRDNKKEQERKQKQQKREKQKAEQEKKKIPKKQALRKLDELKEHEKRELKRQMQQRPARGDWVENDW